MSGKRICGAETRTCGCGHHLKAHLKAKTEGGRRGACSSCRCRAFKGKPHNTTAVMPNGRCRLHGGLSPGGPASPNWKHGRSSRYGILPAGLAEQYLRTSGQTDAELLSLTEEIQLLDARSGQILTEGAKSKSRKDMRALWKQLEGLIEQRRKLVESEQRRRKDAQETLSIRQGMALVSVVADAVRTHVTNVKEQAAVFMALQRVLRPGSHGLAAPMVAEPAIVSEEPS